MNKKVIGEWVRVRKILSARFNLYHLNWGNYA